MIILFFIALGVIGLLLEHYNSSETTWTDLGNDSFIETKVYKSRGTVIKETMYYERNERLNYVPHRTDGPAFVRVFGDVVKKEQFCIHGVELTKEQFDLRVSVKDLMSKV